MTSKKWLIQSMVNKLLAILYFCNSSRRRKQKKNPGQFKVFTHSKKKKKNKQKGQNKIQFRNFKIECSVKCFTEFTHTHTHLNTKSTGGALKPSQYIYTFIHTYIYVFFLLSFFSGVQFNCVSSMCSWFTCLPLIMSHT